MKIVINKCYGGYSLSKEAIDLYVKYSGKNRSEINEWGGNITRNDPNLIRVVEELGDKANGEFAELKIVEIPDDVDWVIEEHDGLEWVAEKHRVWD